MDSEEEILLVSLLLRRRQKKRKPRRWCIKPLNQERISLGEYSSTVLRMNMLDDEESHMQYFRMTRARFLDLLNKIENRTEHRPTHRNPITPAERLAVALRFLASGASQRWVAQSYPMGSATVHKILGETCDAIWKTLKANYIPVPTKAMWKEIEQGFREIWHSPNLCGVIDGKHVDIVAPNNSGSLYFNYKGRFSIVLMVVVDHYYNFILLDIGGYGHQSDGGTWANSPMGRALGAETLDFPEKKPFPGCADPVPHVFPGDEAFPLRTNIMRPFPGKNLTHEQLIYNYRISRARVKVKNAFGILSAKWRVYRGPLECEPALANKIVQATVALHNYLRKSDKLESNPGRRYLSPLLVEDTIVDGVVQAGGGWTRDVAGGNAMRNIGRIGSNRYRRNAFAVRNQFVQYFQSATGSVPWQNRAVYGQDAIPNVIVQNAQL